MCGEEVPASPRVWRCPSCGGPLDLDLPPIDPRLPLGFPVRLSLGEPVTPLVEMDGAILKLEGALPTGSFKDRGAAALVGWLAEHGVEAVVEDSSGNAGAALAAYCARAGIACELYVPESAPRAKLAQIEAYGGRLVPVPGPRPEAARAAERAAAEGAVYASHAWSPLYLLGTRTFALELWDQLGREAPDVLVVPVGGGSLLLGAHLGFAALREAGLVDRIPRLVCAQAEACAPLVRAIAAGSPEPVAVQPEPTLADGIVIPEPVRGRQVIAAVRETGGTGVAVSEDEIRAAYERSARGGLLVERTSAVALAALRHPGVAEAGERIVVAVTGNGLKTPPPV